MGQFERTLIIADEGSSVHYVEGCTAPIYKSDSLHSAVVEIVVKKDAKVRYTTIQNWSNNVYNLRSEEHTSELQSRGHLVCRLLLEKKKIHTRTHIHDTDQNNKK